MDFTSCGRAAPEGVDSGLSLIDVACTITISAANGIVQSGQTDPSVLRVTGTAIGCTSNHVVVTTSISAATAPVTVDGNGRFRADIPITASPLPHCGDLIDVRVECSGQPACFALEQQRPLTCCEIPVLFFQGVTPLGSLTPSHLLVQGVARGCPLDQVIISSSHTATSAPISVDPMTGAFTTTLPLTMAAQCDDDVLVSVVCPSGAGCQRAVRGKLDCASCFRAAVSVVVGACAGTPPVAPVTLNANIGLAVGTSQTFVWDFGDGTTSAPFTVTNSTSTAATPLPHNETHDYAPGTYTAVLEIPGSECPELRVTFVVQCASTSCPTITLDPPQLSSTCVNGKYTVTLTAHMSAPTGQTAVVQWNYGDGSLGPATVVNGGTSVVDIKAHDFAPGTYTATLDVILPTGCPPQTVTVVVPTCPTEVCTLQVQNIIVQIGPCDSVTGNRTVVATGVVNNTDPADLYYWQWDSNPAQVGFPAATGLTRQHDYAAPGSGATSYTITLTVVRSTTCVSTYSKTISIDGCGGGCPTILSLQLDGTTGSCTPDRLKRAVSLSATIVDPSAVANYHWVFDDGTVIDLPGSAGPSATHAMTPGMHTVTLTITGPGACSSTLSAQVNVAVCCPVVTGIVDSPGTCPSGSPTRPVTLTAQVAGVGVTTFDWSFGDNTAPAINAGITPPAHNYAPGGPYTVAVTMHSPGCPDSTASAQINVAGCTPTTPPTNSLACDILLWLSIALVLLGFLVGIIGCIVEHFFPQAGWIIQIIGGALVLIGIILFFIWWIVCRFVTPCQVILAVRELVRWLIRIFGIITVIMAIISIFISSFHHCALYAAVTWGYWGLVLDMLDFIAEQRKCIIVNPSGGASSSSSSLTSSGDTTDARSRQPHQWSTSPGGVPSSQTYANNDSDATRVRGLGDVIKAATNAAGIKPCAPCQERSRRLNELVPFGTDGTTT
jgi:PKD domain